ncbi:3-oxoacyl-ACP synthase III family protein [Streptomyces brasiliscabiei]|uniref:3-oxoacyl-ACP synthase III family protein n=1 Tax=Streptomyces brasiliscabiei TaxID=2736302 RepID=UPI001C0F9565|nr:ketoacyl-ACP synthase III [Streptomyces brasiliscabiei]
MANDCVGILATGSYLPRDVISNEELARRVGTSAEWIERKTQIRNRRYAAPDEAASDLAVRAAEQALAQAGVTADRIDCVIVSTSTGDAPLPPTSHLVQRGLKAHNAACLDLNVVCSGFVYGLALARAFISSHPRSHVLVIAAEVYSRILDFDDRRTAVLFGDGAGAAVVGPVPSPYGFVAFDLSSHGEGRNLVRVEGGGSRRPASHRTVDAREHYFRMDGRQVRDFVMTEVPPTLERLSRRAGIPFDRIDHLVPHQGNGALLHALVEEAGLTHVMTHRTVEEYGNVGSASIPVTLDEASRAGRLRDGDLLMVSGFGGGLSLGSCLLRWAAPR